jgi:hypothetical protein
MSHPGSYDDDDEITALRRTFNTDPPLQGVRRPRVRDGLQEVRRYPMPLSKLAALVVKAIRQSRKAATKQAVVKPSYQT